MWSQISDEFVDFLVRRRCQTRFLSFTLSNTTNTHYYLSSTTHKVWCESIVVHFFPPLTHSHIIVTSFIDSLSLSFISSSSGTLKMKIYFSFVFSFARSLAFLMFYRRCCYFYRQTDIYVENLSVNQELHFQFTNTKGMQVTERRRWNKNSNFILIPKKSLSFVELSRVYKNEHFALFCQ